MFPQVWPRPGLGGEAARAHQRGKAARGCQPPDRPRRRPGQRRDVHRCPEDDLRPAPDDQAGAGRRRTRARAAATPHS
eukprot:4626880-Alexandrium_andersonii.AAC.1